MRLFDRPGLASSGPLLMAKPMPRRRMPRPSVLPTVIATTPWSRFVRRLRHVLGRP